MNFVIGTTSLDATAADLLAVGVKQGEVAQALQTLDGAFGNKLSEALAADEFDGKAGSGKAYPTFGHVAAKRILLVGIGDGSPAGLAKAAGRAGSLARDHGVTKLALHLGHVPAKDISLVVEALQEGNYRFDKYKPEKDRKPALDTVVLLGTEKPVDGFGKASAVAAGQSFARDLVNEPAGVIYPETLAKAAEALAGGRIKVTVWDEKKIVAEGMGGIAGVGQGSERPPRFVHMTYTPPGTPRAKLCIIGKGVTFDSGGLSLKTSAGMMTMRCDMSGSAAVIGTMKALKEIEPDVEVHGIFGAVENMPSGTSYKLGDVLKMYSGKTVEIHNTDAEGRLVLADCLHYATKLGIDAMVDLATLTGACVIALGEDVAGLFTPDDKLATSLQAAATRASEQVWRMPLPESYKEKIKGEWGSIKNVGGPDGGAITAALFLAEFAGDRPWAHLDIAGPAFYDKAHGHLAAGGTGVMVRTLVEWITTP
jgi:leucyl aminopeptidase